MPDEKLLRITINLINAKKNNAEITKLEKSLKSMHDNLMKVNKTFKSTGASKEMASLRSEINKVSGSLKDMFKGKYTNLQTLAKEIVRITTLTEKMISSIKKTKEAWGTRAREDLPALEAMRQTLKALSTEVGKADSAY